MLFNNRNEEMLKELVLHALMALTPWSHELETAADREVRMALNAGAIASVVQEFTCAEESADCVRKWEGSIYELAAAIIILGKEESRWASHIQMGMCGKHPKSRRGECDGGRAVSPYQLHRNNHMTPADWEELQTVAGAPLATRFAARYLVGYYRICGHWEGAFASYGTGRIMCDMDAADTVAPWKWVKRSRLTQEMLRDLLHEKSEMKVSLR